MAFASSANSMTACHESRGMLHVKRLVGQADFFSRISNCPVVLLGSFGNRPVAVFLRALRLPDRELTTAA
ncbi:hypothetical protein NXT3_PC01090 (plasmid) [Sinorhizobium fredii]|uniref:Uncharacterized protein n=1 Tax=Rhizobium fredii TaxID=380 RepID=A0A2L0HFI9_RHIFR|nr:hypothetical protein NXT3_PC01090 [Sinorhizobium fredii]